MDVATNLQILAILGAGIGISALLSALLVSITDKMNGENNNGIS